MVPWSRRVIHIIQEKFKKVIWFSLIESLSSRGTISSLDVVIVYDGRRF